MPVNRQRKAKCYWCKGAMEPRAGRLFCSNACKQAAYRWRKQVAQEELVQLQLELQDMSNAKG